MIAARIPWSFMLAAACWLGPLVVLAVLVSMRPSDLSLASPSLGRGTAGARCSAVAESHLPDLRAMRAAFVACMKVP